MIRQWRGKRQFTLKTILLFIATASVFLAIYQWRATVARRAAKELYLEAYRSGFLLNAVMPPFRIVYDKPAGDEGFLDGKNALAQIYPVDVEPFSYNSEVRTRAIIPLVEKATHIRPACKKKILYKLKTWEFSGPDAAPDNKTLDRSGNNYNAFPEFSWDHVSRFVHVGVDDGLEEEQLNYLADNYALIQFTGGTGDNPNVQYIIRDHAKVIKNRNPKAKVLFYLPSGNARGRRKDIYDSYPLDGFLNYSVPPKPEKVVKNKSKPLKVKGYFDILNEDVRDWWSDIGFKAVTEFNCDGLIVDGVLSASKPNEERMQAHQAVYGKDLPVEDLENAMKEMLLLTGQKMGPDKILSYIAIQGSHKEKLAPRGVQYLPVTNAVWMADYYRNPEKSDAYYLASSIELLRDTAKEGKLVTFKAWPGFRWKEEELDKMSAAELHDMCKERITFLLASFLAGAEPHCYFSYTWGWNARHGAFLDYPEFHKPLGPPKGDATRNGWIFTREFEHASIWVDVEAKIGKINWKVR